MIMNFNIEDKISEFVRGANSSVAESLSFFPTLADFLLREREINDILLGIF